MSEDVKAHITGVVFQVTTKPGDAVAAGDPVIVLESMKMEIPVEAPRAGTVREIRVAEGQTVSNAELSPTEKDAISHRGKAFRAMAKLIAQLAPIVGE